jgi:hypothetical protein
VTIFFSVFFCDVALESRKEGCFLSRNGGGPALCAKLSQDKGSEVRKASRNCLGLFI